MIARGELEEKDRTIFENNSKMIALSSASYTFENLYKTYQEWINKIQDEKGSMEAKYFVSQLGYEALPEEMIDKTIIEDHVKIDDLVQIGHNAIIKKFSQIAAGTIISGRVKIGVGCWIAPNVVVDNGNEIGDNCLVGSLSLVKTNFPKNSIIVGSPARLLKKNV